MKRIFSVIVCMVIVFNGLHSQCQTTIFSDNFEASTSVDPMWVQNGPYTRTILTSGSPQGINHLQQVGSGSHYDGMRGDFPSSTPSHVSYWGKSPASPNNCGYFVLGDAGTPTNNGIVFAYFTSAGSLRFYNNTVNYEIPVTNNTWYYVELRNINFTAKTFDLWINGVLHQTAYAFRSMGSINVNQVHLYNYLGSTDGYYDDILISNGTDTIDPVITAPSNVSGYADAGLCSSSTVVLGTPIASDNCGVASITNDAPGIFPVGITNVTWTVIDSAGNSSTDLQMVTIADTVAPTLTAPADTMIAANNSGCTGSLILGTPVFSDNCLVSVSNDAPSTFPVGTTIVTWTATDSSGNITIQTQNVTVIDSMFTVGLGSTVSCFGMSDGNIDLTITGGNLPISFNWNSGTYTTEDLSNIPAGNYIGIITDNIGCTDTVSIFISEPAQINTTVNLAGATITAQQASATYQWIDCNNGNSPIAGQTNQAFTATSNGSYAVIVTVGACSDTSNCIVINNLSVENDEPSFLYAYPNPSNGIVNLTLTKDIQAGIVKIIDLTGKILFTKTDLNGAAFSFDISAYRKGIYILQIQEGLKNHSIKLIRN